MKWFTAQANGDGTANVIIDKIIASDWTPDWIVDFFGEKSARDFIDAVDALGDLTEINLKVNTPGGDVFSGIRIANYLINHKATVHVTVEGMAASIGSVIMLGGDTRTMLLGSRVMAHKPSAGLDGWFTAEDLRNHADRVDEIENAIIEIYVARTGQTEETIRDMLSQGDYYMDADKAIAMGFATGKSEQLKAAACVDQVMFDMQAKLRAGLVRAEQAEAKYVAMVDKYDLAADRIVALTSELEAFKNPAAATAEFVIEACGTAELEGLAVAMIKEKLPEATVTQRLALAGKVRDIAKAGGIEADPLLAHLGDPLKMMQHAIVEAKAAVDPDLDTNHHQHKPDNHADSWSAAFSKTTK